MRCYLTTDGRYVATQAEAGNGFSKVDWPDDKPGQLAALNALVDQIRAECAPLVLTGGSLPHVASDDPQIWRRMNRIPWSGADGEPEAITPNAPPPVQPARTPAAHTPTLTDAETVIQAADHRELCSLTENVILRMRELGREAGL
jgi:hypothetical protein